MINTNPLLINLHDKYIHIFFHFLKKDFFNSLVITLEKKLPPPLSLSINGKYKKKTPNLILSTPPNPQRGLLKSVVKMT